MGEVERTLANLAARQTQLDAEVGPVRSTIMETERQRSLVIGRDPVQGKQLTDELGWGRTELVDLYARKGQLAQAERAIKLKGSTGGVAIAPPRRRPRITSFGDRSSKPNAGLPTITIKSTTRK